MQVLEFVHGPDQVFGPAVLDGASGQVDVLLGQTVDDMLDGDAGPEQLLFVDEDMNLLLQAAADAHGGHTFHRLKKPPQLDVGDSPQTPQPRFTLVEISFT